MLLFFSRQLRFFSSQFLCLPLPRNNHIHSKPIPTPGNKQVLLTKSLTTSQTRTQQHFSTASFCLVQHTFLPLLLHHSWASSFLFFQEIKIWTTIYPTYRKLCSSKLPIYKTTIRWANHFLPTHHPILLQPPKKTKTCYLKTPRKCMNLLLQQQLQLLLSYYSYSCSFPNPLSCFSPSLPSPPPPPLPAAAATAATGTATPPPVPVVVVTPDENDKARHQPIPQNALYISVQQEEVL